MNIPKLYKKFHVDKEHTSIGLFVALNAKYSINKVFYPGSHVHITPSLVFREVIYADSFKNTFKFFEDPETIAFLVANKRYEEEAIFRFYQQDYERSFEGLGNDFDLVISQYAGFVGQAVKSYLKIGGLLVCNNSHGDASLASLDPSYQLIAVYKRLADDKFTISAENLEDYMIPKNGVLPIREDIITKRRGIAYTRSPSGYIFKKVKD